MSAPLLFALFHAFEHLAPEALPAPHRLVLLVQADAAAADGRAWLSAATIAQRTGQSQRTVETCLQELEAAGWIAGERRKAGGRPLSTVFEVRTSGEAIARRRPGRHTAGGAESNTAPRSYRAPCGTAPGAVSDTAGGAVDTAGGAEDPLKDPIRSPTGSEIARAGGERSIELDRRELGLDEDLLGLVATLAAEGLPFGVSLAEKLGSGRRPSPSQIEALQRIRAERGHAARAGPRARAPSPTLQAEGNWKTGEEF